MSIVSQFVKNPNSKYFHTINQILQYFTRNTERDITFRKDKKVKLIDYLDSE